MGKRVLAGLLAAAAIFVLSRPQSAQEAPPQPKDAFKPGKFFTQDDYDHLKAALEVINLTPEDLKYEKKHKPNDTLRLKVCDAALDDPLGLPLVTENAAEVFSVRQRAGERCRSASRFLDLPDDRWRGEELEKDAAPIQKPLWSLGALKKALAEFKGDKESQEYKGLADTVETAKGTLRTVQETAIFGDTPEMVVATSKQGDFQSDPGSTAYGPLLAISSAVLTSRGPVADVELAQVLASTMPGMVAEAEIKLPGGKPDQAGALDFDAAAGINTLQILLASSILGAAIVEAAEEWTDILKASPDWVVGAADHKVEGVTGSVVAAYQGKSGKFVIGGTGPNTYEGDDFIGIIDLGGDDVYKGRVACGIGLPGQSPISFVLDLGGNDRYEGGDFTQGFGFLGVGILHDLGGGNDYYKSRFCAQGCGLCGYGELYDDGGDDIYLADSGAQGAGCFGYGHLIDKSGNDIYRGARYVQGFAQVMGVGVLTDGDGNDLYYAGGKYLHQPLWNDRYQSLSQGFAIGNRNDRGVGTGGGVALLLDEGTGNDVYHCDIYGQGSSYWYSLGMLVDRGGNDTYTLGQYGQGAGIHLSAAILYDESGNDTYSMGVGLGQGAAHDWAVGWLIDRAGNDSYQGSGQGMGLNFSLGILLDCAGDDSHGVNSEGSIGKGHNNDISILLDLAGTDSYGPKEIKDGQFTRRGPHQLVYDVPQGWFPDIDTSTWPTKQPVAPEQAVVQHILIAWDGTGIDTQKAARTKEQAWELAQQVMKQARTMGADWKQLQADYNEDSAKGEDFDNTHSTYDVIGDATFVKSFEDMSLSLGVGQINICESKYGYHIIKRLE